MSGSSDPIPGATFPGGDDRTFASGLSNPKKNPGDTKPGGTNRESDSGDAKTTSGRDLTPWQKVTRKSKMPSVKRA